MQHRRCSENGRQVRATLTDQGYDVFVRAAPRAAAQVRSVLFDGLTREQVRQLRDIFHPVLVELEGPPDGSRAGTATDPVGNAG